MRIALLVLLPALALAQTTPARLIRTFAGTDWSFPFDPRPAIAAPLGLVSQTALDGSGNLYIPDQSNHLILKVDSSGTLSVFAGNGLRGFSGDGGDARNASFSDPKSVALGPDGSLYIADSGNLRIRRIFPDGIIRTIAGTGGFGFRGDGGPALSALLAGPADVNVDRSGNVFVADTQNNRVRRIDSAGVITTIAGNGSAAFSGDGGPAVNASLNFPQSVRVTAAGDVYIADTENNRVRRVSNGTITTHASEIPIPVGLDFDAQGNLYIQSLFSLVVRKNAAPGSPLVTVAGGVGTGFSGDGGAATQARMAFMRGLTVAADGSFYLSDTLNRRVRRVGAGGAINTIAGNFLYRFAPDGTNAEVATFQNPTNVAVDPNGRVLVADRDDFRVRRIGVDRRLSTVAGTGLGFGTNFGAPGPLPATQVPINDIGGIVSDGQGNLFLNEAGHVRKITPGGEMTTIAGCGCPELGDGGPATKAALQSNRAAAVDATGTVVYIADTYHFRVRKIAADGTITTIAGTGISGFSGDNGPAAQAQIALPFGIALDPSGNVHFSDAENGRIRKIDSKGVITTVAGGGNSGPVEGGPAISQRLSSPQGIAFDRAGNLYIAETNASAVRVVDVNGNMTTLAGTGEPGFSGDGGPARLARLNGPTGVAVDADGNVYIADSGNARIRVVPAVTPPISRSPASLTFTARSGDAIPPPRQVSLTSAATGIPFTLSFATQSGGPWLSATAPSSLIPATIDVSVNPATLAPGAYSGTVTITPGVAGVAPLTVAVTFQVLAAEPAQLSSDSSALSFSFVRGAARSDRRVNVLNLGGGSVSFTVTVSGGGWLTASPGSGTVSAASPAAITVSAEPGTLSSGVYSGVVTVASAAGEVRIPVSMTISSVDQLLRLSQSGLTFTAVAGVRATPSQSVAVLSTSSLPLAFTATVVPTAGEPNWLSVTPSNGVTDPARVPPQLELAVNPAGLAAGDYYRRIEVAAPGAANSPQSIIVVLNVLDAGANPGPLVQPAGLVFTGAAGAGDSGSQVVTINNLTSAALSYGSGPATLDGGRWLVYQPAASAAPTGSTRMVVQPSLSGLAAGVYRGAITLVFSDGAVRPVSVLLVVGPAGSPAASGRAADASCAPTKLLPLLTSLGANFTVPTGWPTPLEVRVVDDCGNPHLNGAVRATFSNGDPALAMSALRDGRWTATWAKRNTPSAQVIITISADAPVGALRGTAQFGGSVSGTANPPSIIPGAVLSAASYARETPLAPGSLISIFGTLLSEGLNLAESLPLSFSLGGTRAIVAGRQLPLVFTSGGQVNAVLPFDLAVNTRHQMIVSHGGKISQPEDIAISTAQPGIFTLDSSGQGRGHIYIAGAGGSLRLSTPQSPAQAGDVLVVYTAGLGAVDTAVEPGHPSPGSPPARTTNPVSATIGGVDAPILFSGLAPGFTGVYQLNIQVPAGVSGDAVALVVTAAGQASRAALLSVQ